MIQLFFEVTLSVVIFLLLTYVVVKYYLSNKLTNSDSYIESIEVVDEEEVVPVKKKRRPYKKRKPKL